MLSLCFALKKYLKKQFTQNENLSLFIHLHVILNMHNFLYFFFRKTLKQNLAPKMNKKHHISSP